MCQKRRPPTIQLTTYFLSPPLLLLCASSTTFRASYCVERGGCPFHRSAPHTHTLTSQPRIKKRKEKRCRGRKEKEPHSYSTGGRCQGPLPSFFLSPLVAGITLSIPPFHHPSPFSPLPNHIYRGHKRPLLHTQRRRGGNEMSPVGLWDRPPQPQGEEEKCAAVKLVLALSPLPPPHDAEATEVAQPTS